MEIRDATASDIPALCALKAAAAARAYAAHDADALSVWIERNCGQGHFSYRIGRRHYTVLVAERQGEIVGVAYMRVRGKRADMSGLYVAEDSRGIGRALVAAREAAAIKAGCTHARVGVFRTNDRARKFAEAQGFSKIAYGYRERVIGVMIDCFERPLASAASPARLVA